MSITRVKSAGWGLNEELTSPQITQVDINTSFCLDKRSGQSDTLSSAITVPASGSITFTNASTLAFQSSAVLNLQSTSFLQADGESHCTFAGFVNLEGLTTFVSGSSFNGTLAMTGAFNVTATASSSNSEIDCGANEFTLHCDGGFNFNAVGSNSQNHCGSQVFTVAAGTVQLLSSGNATVNVGGNVQFQVASAPVVAFTSSLASFNTSMLLGNVVDFVTLEVFGQYWSLTSAPAFASTVTVDFSKSNVVAVGTITGACVLSAANVKDGARYEVFVFQNPVGGNAVTWNVSTVPIFWGGFTTTAATSANTTTRWGFVGRFLGGSPFLFCTGYTTY